MNVFVIVSLMLVAVVLMLLELFLIPGFGIAGVASFCSFVGAVVWAYLYVSPLAGHVVLLLTLLLMGCSIYVFLRGKALEKMSLKTNISDKVDLLSGLQVNVGDKVVTASRLAPMGKVLVDGKEVEARSASFVEPDTQVEVIRVEGNVLVVKPVGA